MRQQYTKIMSQFQTLVFFITVTAIGNETEYETAIEYITCVFYCLL